ncbi:MAG: M14 family metallopeptidase, partial [Acidobacteriota bacterium]|nr:M14 family metallopeptidase [Acidobacteriota bacterium]
KGTMRTRILIVVLTSALVLPLLASQTSALLINSSTRLATPNAHIPAPAQISAPAHIPAPEEVLGFVPGDDRKLASWNQVLEYFAALAKASDRVKFETLGKSTMGKPFVMATISAPENLARLEEYKRIQELLADPRKLGAPGVRDRKAAKLIQRGKTVVLITCGIHSTEVGSYLSSMLIAHRLASSDAPEIQSILRNTIILLVPSLNPDGVDIVKNWYDKTLGTPYEGTDPPELYHKYTGHDNNRDWYAFTQVETKITVDKIHNVWHPQIVHDIHQQGEFGARLFLPPYMAPVEPNVPKQIVEGYTELGNWMAKELRNQGFKGITTNSTYDAWTPARAYSHYHGGVRILSETASARIASPITVRFDQLRSREGYDPQKESSKFGPLWRGGEWHLRDITNYMTTAAFTLLTHAAHNRERWLSRFYEIGRSAVRPRRAGELYAFVIPPADHLGTLLTILERAGVKVDYPGAFTANQRRYPQGAAVVRMAQPYGNFAKALLEVQRYPDLRDSSGHPIQPYDVTAHTLPLLMGVPVEATYVPFALPKPKPEPGTGSNGGCGGPRPARRAIYRSHWPSMDEGWTRWVLENDPTTPFSCLFYETLEDAEARAGNLREKFDAIVLPDQESREILNGHRSGTMPLEYTGGLGGDGVKALREFVEQGGTLVLLNRASDFAIEQFKLPVRNIVAGVPERDFFVPGSILRIELDTSSPIAEGMPKETIAWVEDSPVFEIVRTGSGPGSPAGQPRWGGSSDQVNPPNVRVIARYPTDKSPLLSGWLLGENRIRGKAALVELTMGKGRVILFGFRPQYRGQSLATYPLFFNAIATRPQ